MNSKYYPRNCPEGNVKVDWMGVWFCPYCNDFTAQFPSLIYEHIDTEHPTEQWYVLTPTDVLDGWQNDPMHAGMDSQRLLNYFQRCGLYG